MSHTSYRMQIGLVVFLLGVSLLFLVTDAEPTDADVTVEKDGIVYTLYDRNMSAEGNGGGGALPSKVTIPRFIEHEGEQYRVTAINSTLTSGTVTDLVIEGNPGLVLKTDLFAESYGLRTVVIGEGVSLSERMFYKCWNLKSVTLPDSLTMVPKEAFSGCSGLASLELGPNVKSIGDGAFEYCRTLSSVGLPNSVEVIGARAFLDCSNLTEFTIGDNIKSIGQGALDGTKIQRFRIPAGLLEIGIGPNCFLNNIDTLIVDKENPSYCVVDGILYSKDRSVLWYYPNSLTTSDRTFSTSASIGQYAFHKTSLTKIVIEDGARYISQGAFEGSNLTEVRIADSVTTIGEGAFKDCGRLATVNMPSGLDTISKDMFKGCVSLKRISLPDSVSSIGEAAFSDCRSLTEVEVGSNVEYIGKEAFASCMSLSSMDLPDRLKEIGMFAFKGTAVQISELPSRLERIGARAFEDCYGVKITVIPDSVKEIANNAFKNTGIVELRVGENSQVELTIESGSISGILNTFSGRSLERIYLNKVVTDSPDVGSMISMCPNLKVIELGPDFDLWEWDENGLGVKEGTAYLLNPASKGLMLSEDIERIYGTWFQRSRVEWIDYEGSPERTITFETGQQKDLTSSGTNRGMFRGCQDLVAVRLPTLVLVNNEESTFNGCTSLREVHIGGADNIPAKTFYDSKTEVFSIGKCKEIKDISTHIVGRDQVSSLRYIAFPGDLVKLNIDRALNNSLKFYDGDGNAIDWPADAGSLAGRTFVQKGPNQYQMVGGNDRTIELDYGGFTTFRVIQAGGTPNPEDFSDVRFSEIEWYTDPGLTSVYVPQPVDENIRLYAKATLRYFKLTIGDDITVSSDGRTYADGDSVPYGTVLNVSALVKDGNNVTMKVNKKNVASPAVHTVEGDCTFEVTYSVKKINIEFDTGKGTKVNRLRGNFGSPVTAPNDPTRDGYIFAGWAPELPDTYPASNLTVRATWQRTECTVSLESDGSVIATLTKGFDTEYSGLPSPTRTGYRFTGWYDADGNLVDEETAMRSLSDHTLYAGWQIIQYTISFNTAGGNDIASITRDYGAVVPAPEDPAKEGYLFLGWDPAMPSTMPADDVRLTARWALVATTGGDGHADVSLGDADALFIPAGTTSVHVKLTGTVSVKIEQTSSVSGKTVTLNVSDAGNVSGIQGKAYDLSVETDGEMFNGRMIVTLPYEPQNGRSPAVYYWNGTEAVKMRIVGHSDTSVSFETDHNSVYIVSNEDALPVVEISVMMAMVAIAAGILALVWRRV